MDKKIALENLRDAVEVLNQYKAYWWITAGTCLGAIREKDFIDHDDDIDIGILYNSKKQRDNIIAGMMKKGFELKHIFGKKNAGLEYSFIKKGVKIDFFYYDESVWKCINDGYCMSIWQYGKRIILDFPAYLFEELKEIDFLGLKVNVPNPPEDYLNIRYGDWKKVVKDWDWAYGAHNTRGKNGK